MDESSNDVNTPVETQETTPAESSPVESKAPEVANDDVLAALSDEQPKEEVKTEEPVEAEPKEAPPEEQPNKEGEEQETEEQPRGKKDANQRIRQLVARNKELERQIEEANNRVYRPQTVEELMAEGDSEAVALAKSVNQRLEVENFNRQVTDLNNTIDYEATKVLEDFPMFDDQSPEFDKELADRVAELYERQIQKDPKTGIVISATVTPYEFYKAFADVRSEAAKTGEANGKIAGQRATAQMLASAEPQTSAAPRETKKDPILEALTSSD